MRVSRSEDCTLDEKAFPVDRDTYIELVSDPAKLATYKVAGVGDDSKLVQKEMFQVSNTRMFWVPVDPGADVVLQVSYTHVYLKCHEEFPEDVMLTFMFSNAGNPLDPYKALTIAPNTSRPLSEVLGGHEEDDVIRLLRNVHVDVNKQVEGFTFGLEFVSV